jgi:hypothetical protein
MIIKMHPKHKKIDYELEKKAWELAILEKYVLKNDKNFKIFNW